MVRAETVEEVAQYCQAHACSVRQKCDLSPKTAERIRSRSKAVRGLQFAVGGCAWAASLRLWHQDLLFYGFNAQVN